MSIRRLSKLHTRLNALDYATRVWEALDTPMSLSCTILAKAKEYRQLVEKSVRPLDYSDPVDFFLDYQAVKLLSKYPYLETGIDREAVAYEKFIWAEKQCLETNNRFRGVEDGSVRLTDRVNRVISIATRKISDILGPVPSLEDVQFSFGPGAAYGVRGDTSVFKKVSSAFECTFAFVDKLPEFLEEFPGWVPDGIHDVNLIPGSQLSFVPKDAKTDRSICIEPLLNGLYQKGFGSWIRKRLRSHGINLNDQGVNQKLAALALDRRLATVDFSSASDTVAYRLVLDLLPFPWFEALEVARSPCYLDKGKRWRNFHKFTSMGNAYTFELESLIFYALAYACCVEEGVEPMTGFNLSVYGDDVIIPQDVFGLFQETAEVCGFALNREKSFAEGLFFESCGQDYFNGELVRPFLIKKKLNNLLPSYYAANTIRRLQKRLTEIRSPSQESKSNVVRRLDDVHSWCVRCIPADLRLMGPEGYGDGHLVEELDRASSSRTSGVSRHRQFDAWWFRTYVEAAERVTPLEWPMAYALYFTRGSDPSEQEFEADEGLRRLRKQLQAGQPSQVGGKSRPPDKGSDYALRGKTRVRKVRVLCHGTWHGYKDFHEVGDYPVPAENWTREANERA